MQWNPHWKRIVFVPMDRVGDAVSDTPALACLHALQVEVIVLATPYTAQIFECNPHVFQVVTYSRARQDGFITAWRINRKATGELAALRPDAVLGMMRPIRELRDIYATLGVPVLNRPQDTTASIARRWVNFFRQLGLDAYPAQNELSPSIDDSVQVEHWLQLHAVDMRRPVLVVHPGCAVYKSERAVRDSLRYWALENYLELFDRLPDTFQIILTGIAPSEIVLNQKLKRLSPRKTAVFDIKNVRSLAALIARADALLTLDTGALHIGATTHTPIVTLFGPTTPAKYGPFRDNITYVMAADHPPCWPCDQNAICNGNNICMQGIRPQSVVQAILEGLHDNTAGMQSHGDDGLLPA